MIKVVATIYINTDDPEVALATVNDYLDFGTPVKRYEVSEITYGWEVETEDPMECGLVRLQ